MLQYHRIAFAIYLFHHWNPNSNPNVYANDLAIECVWIIELLLVKSPKIAKWMKSSSIWGKLTTANVVSLSFIIYLHIFQNNSYLLIVGWLDSGWFATTKKQTMPKLVEIAIGRRYLLTHSKQIRLLRCFSI